MKSLSIQSLLIASLILLPVYEADSFNYDYSFENTNIAAYQEEQRFSDFNRLRLNVQMDDERIPQLSANLIINNNTTYSREENELDNALELYRGTIEYGTDKHLLIGGRQRIPFGVGRIWNPIDIFNPIDSTSVEPAEREGVDGLRYEYAISELAGFDINIAEKKGAARLKGFLAVADFALVTVIDNDEEQIIIGWEVEGELADTGIDMRSEGGSFYDQTKKEYHTEFIVGAEYGFSNSLTLLFEYYYNDNSDIDQLGMTMSYQLSHLLILNMLAMINIDDLSFLLSPTITYSLSDEMTLAAGFFLYHSDSGDSFGDAEDMVFIRWFVHF